MAYLVQLQLQVYRNGISEKDRTITVANLGTTDIENLDDDVKGLFAFFWPDDRESGRGIEDITISSGIGTEIATGTSLTEIENFDFQDNFSKKAEGNSSD